MVGSRYSNGAARRPSGAALLLAILLVIPGGTARADCGEVTREIDGKKVLLCCNEWYVDVYTSGKVSGGLLNFSYPKILAELENSRKISRRLCDYFKGDDCEVSYGSPRCGAKGGTETGHIRDRVLRQLGQIGTTIGQVRTGELRRRMTQAANSRLLGVASSYDELMKQVDVIKGADGSSPVLEDFTKKMGALNSEYNDIMGSGLYTKCIKVDSVDARSWCRGAGGRQSSHQVIAWSNTCGEPVYVMIRAGSVVADTYQIQPGSWRQGVCLPNDEPQFSYILTNDPRESWPSTTAQVNVERMTGSESAGDDNPALPPNPRRPPPDGNGGEDWAPQKW